ncbi:hypothetical protein [Altererythrobacter sp.]|uniref:hypothetical protein n=1 Tax=Altererythrobacter sp. TaxID=1872480 RepID=UPI001B21634E|nr:hypothetical protein [Altererythrobacter sp.]MBO6609233.1 hypothetical protein [Altererythrobacter sp.]MBO6641241.1 hypothetical protein [Altererythrobacter sp.]MBO6708061.1 hypothetical protein [Altererythrobacter sp.]MBO6945805.1 hypothetical protein [Altererythrobacter sp.]
MLRRLLACFALLTGLVAVTSPAHASVSDLLDCEIGITMDAADDAADDDRTCHHNREEAEEADDGDKAGKPAKRSKRVLRLPVLYGVDRAHE